MRSILVTLAILAPACAALAADLPVGWYEIGDAGMDSYDVSVASDAGIDGPGLSVARVERGTGTFGGVGQAISASNFRGKKVRVSGFIRTEGVDGGYAGLWFRVDKGKDMLVLDNMSNRGVRGTTDWLPYECVIHVDSEATGILFGALLTGTGKMQADKFKVEVVPDDTPTTNVISGSSVKEPRNLDF